MRHCSSPGGRGPCLRRDTGGWITLRRAAEVFKECLKNNDFHVKSTDRVQMPLSEIMRALNHVELQWFLAAFGCVNYDKNKHRVQLLIEKGVNCNSETGSTARGNVSPNLRVFALRFCCGHS